MLSACLPPLLVTALAVGTSPGQSVGYLTTGKAPANNAASVEVEPYVPREGDLIFFDDQSKLWERLYKLGGTAPPFHVGIVVKKPDGSLGILESGPDDTLHVYILDVQRRLHSFKGVLQIRRCLKEISAEESARLTNFAVEQEGKRYAMWRLLLQGTPLRTRGGWKSKVFGATHPNRTRWLCAEIVCTGCAIIGTFNGQVIKGTDTYPLDIVDDHLYDLSSVYSPAGYWMPKAPK
jgi:hypothetical protein